MAVSTLRLNYFISLFSLLLLASCNKNDNYLPPMTREGQNSFGCKLDEALFSKYFTDDSDEIQMLGDTLFIAHGVSRPTVHTKKSTVKIIDLVIDADTLVDFKLKVGYPGQMYNSGVDPSYEFQYVLDSSQNNYFEVIYHDLNRQIIAGQFLLHLVAYDTTYTSDTTFFVESVNHLNAALGRFDFRY